MHLRWLVTSDGDVNRYVRLVRVRIDALGESLAEALNDVPAGHRLAVRARWEEENQQVIRPANVLSGAGGRRPWFVSWDPSAGYYWRRLRAYLLDDVGRTERDIESLDDSSDVVLSHLEDPRADGPQEFRVQGLVLGYVQSGKTANYSALIAKAADLGYKLVIVLSGIHNALRQQTQRRLDRELGVSGDGVGTPEPGRRWIAITTSDLNGDFRPGTLNANVLQGNELVLAVVKKNATVLRRLAEWMGAAAPRELPVLIIDDEADQASINTGGNRLPPEELADLTDEDMDGADAQDELSPSAINAMVRALLQTFGRVSYVGYTATPFANVLINHEGIDREVFEDLYPRDFIVALPRPAGYVGAEALFGREALLGELDGSPGLDVIKLVPEGEVGLLIPGAGVAVDSFEPALVPSLERALHDFVLAAAAKMARAGDGAASMLIHTHQRVRVQNALAEQVQNFVTDLRQRWRYDRGEIEGTLRQHWEGEFRPLTSSLAVQYDVPFEALVEHLDRLFRDPIIVLVLNSASDDVLDYDADPSLKAVLIGGNRLSRGLTLEGLLVSYFVRNTRYFDTLLQMGRWFGFRNDYVDLTRLWTTGQLSMWFRDLALAEEELRREIERYEREGMTPREFGVRIRKHPVMLITARNKMGSARQIDQNYSGELIQTINFRLSDRSWLTENLSATRAFLSALGSPDVRGPHFIWENVPAGAVRGFLARYQTHSEASTVDADFLGEYIGRQNSQGELTMWTVAVVSQEAGMEHTEDIGIEGYPAIRAVERTRLTSNPWSIGTLVNPVRPNRSGDEEIDLSEGARQAARTEAADSGDQLGRTIRAKRDRDRGLLLIYPISRYSSPDPWRAARAPLFVDPESGETVIGIAISFPVSESSATVEYITGSVGDA